MRDLVSHVEASVRTRRLIQPGARVLVAVSGGVDSMVLLEVLHRLAPTHRWTLAVAHFNHRLRGRSSDADERLTRRAAGRLGTRLFVEAGDVRRFASQQKVSIEMAARELRHRFLACAAHQFGAATVATAHHAGDQVELFFLRLLRGAGTQGLGGMKWEGASPADSNLRLVRPLLDVEKTELEFFARAGRIPFREDASNRSSVILRNRIRHELLPLLGRRFQPALARVVLRQVEILGAESDFLEESALNWLRRKVAPPFDRLPLALQRRVLRVQALELGASIDFDLVEMLRRKNAAPVAVSAELSLARNKQGRLRVFRQEALAFKSGEQAINLRLDMHEGDFGGARWRAQLAPSRGHIPRQRTGRECFDANAVGPAIILRHWRRGDRFQPIGMRRPVKLQDLFTNLKVPAAERRRRVIATTAAGEIWWVEGLRIAERFKIRVDTRRVLKWDWHRPG